jgi:hypothetical protein
MAHLRLINAFQELGRIFVDIGGISSLIQTLKDVASKIIYLVIIFHIRVMHFVPRNLLKMQ